MSEARKNVFGPWGLVAAAAVLCLYGPVKANPVLEVSGTHSVQLLKDASVGWSFTTGTSAIEVTALDAALHLSGSTATSTEVRLYDGTGTTLTSATVTTSDPTEGTGIVFNSHTITPVTLAANTTYYIAEDAPRPQLQYVGVTSTPSTSLGVTYGREVAAIGLGNNPTSNPGPNFSPGDFGPDFDAQPASAVPEPASLTLLATGALGLLGYGWRRRRSA